MAIERGNVVVLNNPAVLRKAMRNLKRGRQSYTVEIQAEPVIHDFDTRKASKGVTESIKREIEQDFAKSPHRVKQSTYERRLRAAKDGKSKWYRERYTGEEAGHTPPMASTRWGVDSGRLSKYLQIEENNDKSVSIKAVANRLQGDIPGFESALRRNIAALDPRKVMQRLTVKTAVSESLQSMILTAKSRLAANRREFKKLLFSAVGRGAARLLVG